MGAPVICRQCKTRNGILLKKCRTCGANIGLGPPEVQPLRPGPKRITPVPSAEWETESVTDIWSNAAAKDEALERISAHDLLNYCLLLKQMRSQFEIDDRDRWFDDAVFFLRGAYPFFCHLNLSSEMRHRGRIFGGLNHGKRPSERLRNWLSRLMREASDRNEERLDIFVAEEINGGGGMRRLLHQMKADFFASDINPSRYLDINFTYYLACPNKSNLDFTKFCRETENLRAYRKGKTYVQHDLRLFKGCLLGYDSAKYSGLRYTSKATDDVEKYEALRYRSGGLLIVCPDTQNPILSFGTGDNELALFVGNLAVHLLSPENNLEYLQAQRLIREANCSTCKVLFDRLRNGGDALETEHADMEAQLAHQIRERAFFLNENRNGVNWEVAESNWVEAKDMQFDILGRE